MKSNNREQKPFIDFEIMLKNGSRCSVRYFPDYLGGYEIETGKGKKFYHRVDHFEFRGNRFVSDTLYRSEFIMLDHDQKIDYREIAVRIANELAGLEGQTNSQLALF
jgi:hypothetical protein